MLEASALSCIKEGRSLFNNLSFQLHPGQICHITGANGIGKTSLLRIIAGLSLPASGNLFWEQKNITQNRDNYHQQSLYLGHLAGLKSELNAAENLRFYSDLAGEATWSIDEIYALLAKVGLAGFEDIAIACLSAGQQRRVALARLWLQPRKLWILDEPFTALDKQGLAYLEQLFLQHTAAGGMVLLTSHQGLSLATDEYQLIDLADYVSEGVL